MLEILLSRAADADNHTGPERAAALNGASALAAESGATISTWPEPPEGWTWQDQPGAGGRLVRCGGPSWYGPLELPANALAPVEAVAAPVEAAPASESPQPKAAAKITPRLERFLDLIGRPGGASVSELGGKLGGIKVAASQVRAAGYVVEFDRTRQRYHLVVPA